MCNGLCFICLSLGEDCRCCRSSLFILHVIARPRTSLWTRGRERAIRRHLPDSMQADFLLYGS